MMEEAEETWDGTATGARCSVAVGSFVCNMAHNLCGLEMTLYPRMSGHPQTLEILNTVENALYCTLLYYVKCPLPQP